MEEALANERNLLRTLIDNLPDAIYVKDSEGRFLLKNLADARKMGAASPEETIGKTDFDYYPAALAAQYQADDQVVIHSGQAIINQEEQVVDAANRAGWVSTTKLPLRDQQGRVIGLVGIGHDITAQKQADEEKAKLEAQLYQAYKMESVGRLAGGVAHDFNNMLGVILGHTELALYQIDPDLPQRANLEEIQKAAQRSANLTSQLLAFARQQVIAPKELDLNETVAATLTMLQRMIGENIPLIWSPAAALWAVNIDPTQIDQLLANLCVNARDAISDVGKIMIETGNRVFDEAYCAMHPDCVPGHYVMLSVRDNGNGMNEQTQAHLFEPFFTTKPLGHGTGLGLATVYGIVKQNNGFIRVSSEIGQGTTFQMYLPSHGVANVSEPEPRTAYLTPGGGETILLVEDEPSILRLTSTMLTRLGYHVLSAETPGVAIELSGTHSDPIHLLMTDVIMPEMNGRDLGNYLVIRYPQIKRLFMSGYTAEIIAPQGVLEDGVFFIQKPFSMKDLAAKVREVIEYGKPNDG
jgi:PAS domain S-box-containing protein